MVKISEFRLLNTNRFYLNGTNQRFLHLASLVYGLREFMCFIDRQFTKIYIEEVSGGRLEYIKDDDLVAAIHNFLNERKLLNMDRPPISDKEWFRPKKE
jgi:hypothetical protein